jgi:hypothetical protein
MGSRAVGLTAAVAALAAYQSGTASQKVQLLVGASVERSVANQQGRPVDQSLRAHAQREMTVP